MGYNVAVDGPAGAGKSTIAKLVAKEKNYIYVDTGAMYRAMAIHFLGKGIAPENVADVAGACQDADVTIDYEDGIQQVYLNGENVTDRLRTEEVGNMASKTSQIPAVREKLLELQRGLARAKDVIKEKGILCDFDEIARDIKERDERDMNRATAPLRKADDAHLVDSSHMTIEEVVSAICGYCK